MNDRMHEVWTGWRAAERDGRERDAERALARLFAALPMTAPAAGFADRVLAAAGLSAGGASVAAPYQGWSRAAVAACLSTVGVALAYLVPLLLGLARLVAPGDVAGALVGGFVALLSRLDEALSIWRFLAAASDTLTLVLTAPPVVLTLLALTALSAFTARGLHELLIPRVERSPEYVQA